MTWLEKIRKAPHEKKVRMIWTCVGITVILLFIAWVVTAQVQKDHASDTSIFKTINQGVKDLKSNYRNPLK